MTRTPCTGLQLEVLAARLTPSSLGLAQPAAFQGLDVAITRFVPTDPCWIESPVFAVNFGEGTNHGVDGLKGALGNFFPPILA